MGGNEIRTQLGRWLVKRAKLPSNRGFALLVVMIVLLALTLLFGVVIQATRQSTDDARARIVRLQLHAALDGALASTAYQLSREFHSVQFGVPKIIRVGNTDVAVIVRPEMAKLDVNYAPTASIRRLLGGAGVPSERSAAIANSIVLWRSGVESRGVFPSPEALPQHPFETLADLALVNAIGPDLPACLAPDITVYTRSSGIDASSASPRLRQAIYGSQRIEPSSYYSVVGGEAVRPDLFEITETSTASDGAVRLRRQVVIRLSGNAERLFAIVADALPGADALDSSSACRRLAEHG